MTEAAKYKTPDRKALLASLGLTKTQVGIIREPEKQKVRTGAAKGLLPGSPEQTLIMMTAIAMAAPEAEIRQTAAQSASELPESSTLGYAQSGEKSAVLFFLYQTCKDNKKIRNALYVNRHSPVELLIQAAQEESDDELLEALAGNQQKMTESADFPAALIDNPKLGSIARAKVEEFFTRVYASSLLDAHSARGDDDDGEVVALSSDDTSLDDLPEALTVHGDPEEEEAQAQAELEEMKRLQRERELHGEDEETSDSEPEAEEETLSLYGQIQQMNTAKKIKTALMGNMEARKLLIKESNRLVQESVLKNPRITLGEVEAIAANKQSSQDILRLITSNRTWMRKYSMKVVLVNNPKLPFPTASTLMSQLRSNDLKALAKSRNVNGNVQKQAKQLLAKKR